MHRRYFANLNVLFLLVLILIQHDQKVREPAKKHRMYAFLQFLEVLPDYHQHADFGQVLFDIQIRFFACMFGFGLTISLACKS